MYFGFQVEFHPTIVSDKTLWKAIFIESWIMSGSLLFQTCLLSESLFWKGVIDRHFPMKEVIEQNPMLLNGTFF